MEKDEGGGLNWDAPLKSHAPAFAAAPLSSLAAAAEPLTPPPPPLPKRPGAVPNDPNPPTVVPPDAKAPKAPGVAPELPPAPNDGVEPPKGTVAAAAPAAAPVEVVVPNDKAGVAAAPAPPPPSSLADALVAAGAPAGGGLKPLNKGFAPAPAPAPKPKPKLEPPPSFLSAAVGSTSEPDPKTRDPALPPPNTPVYKRIRPGVGGRDEGGGRGVRVGAEGGGSRERLRGRDEIEGAEWGRGGGGGWG